MGKHLPHLCVLLVWLETQEGLGARQGSSGMEPTIKGQAYLQGRARALSIKYLFVTGISLFPSFKYQAAAKVRKTQKEFQEKKKRPGGERMSSDGSRALRSLPPSEDAPVLDPLQAAPHPKFP